MIRIQKSTLIAFLALIIFFQPTYFSVLPFVDQIYDVLKILVFASIFIYSVQSKQKLLFSSLVLLVGEFWLLTLTVLKHGQIQAELINFAMLCSLVMLVNIYKDKFLSLLEALMLHFELTIYTNILSLLLFPDRLFGRANAAYGLTFEWFLGARNNFINWLLPGLIVALLYKYYYKNSWRPYGLIAAIIATQFFQSSSTLIVTSVLLLGLSFTPYFKRYFRPLISFSVAMFVQFLIIIASNVRFLAPIIEGVLGKDLTFTNRTLIWKNALSHIKFYDGYGKLQSNEVNRILGDFGIYIWNGATHAHNQLLNLGFQGGVVMLLITLWIYIVGVWKCEKNWSNPVAQVLSFGIFVYIVAGITESTFNLLLQLMIILPLFLDRIIMSNNNSNDLLEGNA